MTIALMPVDSQLFKKLNKVVPLTTLTDIFLAPDFYHQLKLTSPPSPLPLLPKKEEADSSILQQALNNNLFSFEEKENRLEILNNFFNEEYKSKASFFNHHMKSLQILNALEFEQIWWIFYVDMHHHFFPDRLLEFSKRKKEEEFKDVFYMAPSLLNAMRYILMRDYLGKKEIKDNKILLWTLDVCENIIKTYEKNHPEQYKDLNESLYFLSNLEEYKKNLKSAKDKIVLLGILAFTHLSHILYLSAALLHKSDLG